MIYPGTPADDEIYGAFDDDLIEGYEGNDILGGGSGNDVLRGGEGNDWLFGGADNDVLVGGEGGDHLYGGAGIDDLASYAEAGRSVIVNLGTGAGYAGDAFGDRLFEIEDVFGSRFDDTLYGDSNANRLDGWVGNDAMAGGDGDDVLIGGTGDDAMYGGRGNDTYWVDSAGDQTNENAAPSDGIDQVFSSISFGLSTQPIENLTLIGSDNLDGIGNGLANTLIGNSGSNFLNGLAGADLMRGMAGHDEYYVDNAGDVVDESVAGSNGTDTVSSFITFDLSNTKAVRGAVEDLVLLGSGGLNAAGNALANHIIGNGGSNVIDGRAGNDWLTGGGGNDFFVFDTAPDSSANFDRILDFNVAMDTIRLDNAIFTRLALGVLADTAFHIGAAAHDADDRIIYNSTSGALLYDVDGTGAAAAIRFAILDPGLALTRGDFGVI